MNASSYLNSLGIERIPPSRDAIGRLVVDSEFHLDGHRGVVVRPKRGGVSDRYLELLAAEGFDYVVVDTAAPPPIYGRAAETGSLEPLRALPLRSPARFPDRAARQQVFDLLARAGRGAIEAPDLGSRVVAAKLADEESDNQIFFQPAATRPNGAAVRRLVDHGLLPRLASHASEEAVATAVALLSGYLLTPRSSDDVAALLEVIARLADPKSWGLPAAAAFAFSGEWTVGKRALVVASQLGAQLLPLRNTEAGQALLSVPGAHENPLLKRLFPAATFVDAEFLAWEPAAPPDLLIVVPPFGRSMSSHELLRRFAWVGKPSTRVPAEVLYIEHAVELAAPNAVMAVVVPEGLLSSMSHASFRASLLERVQLLGVLSLPPSCCFAGTAIRCSVLYLKKTDPVPPDYPIVMIEAEQSDVSEREVQSRLRAAVEEAISGKVRT